MPTLVVSEIRQVGRTYKLVAACNVYPDPEPAAPGVDPLLPAGEVTFDQGALIALLGSPDAVRVGDSLAVTLSREA